MLGRFKNEFDKRMIKPLLYSKKRAWEMVIYWFSVFAADRGLVSPKCPAGYVGDDLAPLRPGLSFPRWFTISVPIFVLQEKCMGHKLANLVDGANEIRALLLR